ncbi:MAG: transferrin-binding protein-like solute binding protein [Synechococcus sp. SB0668_bin_15]|nr:transferrin-binding protein-like solute binding protein [Synechococcus sp. SB0668_bin_15]MYC49167.1 transferrin-binding protein-like solute binding protein [Synechococcus sp. SB0662_bin_14]
MSKISVAAPDIGQSERVGTKNDITLIRQTETSDDNDVNALGAWMLYSFFSIENFSDIDLPGDHDSSGSTLAGAAGGDLTGSRPLGNATWSGLMVGTPIIGENRNEILQGSATFTYDLGDQHLNANFTDIQTLNHEPHSVTTLRFPEVPVSSGGTFSRGTTGNRIQGGFYGPNHAETAGIFEQSNIIGSFGAKKQ